MKKKKTENPSIIFKLITYQNNNILEKYRIYDSNELQFLFTLSDAALGTLNYALDSAAQETCQTCPALVNGTLATPGWL